MIICGLCKKEKPVLDSHIVPKFVFKWLKETGSEYMRNPSKPNIRLQDGIKEKLLCFECEQKISLLEKWFSENIFRNYLAGTHFLFAHGEELGKFVISILWRIAIVSKDNLVESEVSLQQHLAAASEEWRKYLDEGVKPAIYNEFHLLLLPDGWGGLQPNKYVTRYFNRDIDGHIIDLDGECWVYLKFARFMFFARIAGDKPTFRNTKVVLDHGSTLLGQQIIRPELTDYLVWRAEAIYKHVHGAISEKQHKVIQEYFYRNFEKIQKLDLGKRLKDDSTAEIHQFAHDLSFKYVCDCCGKQMGEPEGYILRTFEILLSAHFFRYYFERNGLTTSKEDLEIRQHHFFQLAEQDSPWMICDECIPMFDVNLDEVKKYAVDWIRSKGEYLPPKSVDFREHLSEKQKEEICRIIVTV